MEKTLERIIIRGTIEGHGWYGQKAYKDFTLTLSPDQNAPFARHWQGLRDAVLHITNDGDFQSCAIDSAMLEVIWSTGRDMIHRLAPLPDCKLTHDCLTPDYLYS